MNFLPTIRSQARRIRNLIFITNQIFTNNLILPAMDLHICIFTPNLLCFTTLLYHFKANPILPPNDSHIGNFEGTANSRKSVPCSKCLQEYLCTPKKNTIYIPLCHFSDFLPERKNSMLVFMRKLADP